MRCRIYSRLAPLLLTLCLSSPYGWAQLNPPALQTDWQKVGEARLRVLWFNIYDAALFTPSGRLEGFAAPLKLQLTYQRNISQTDLLNETERLLEPFSPEGKRKQWLQQLSQIWPAVSEDDQLVFQVDREGAGHFFYNRVWIGSIAEPAFSAAFVQIWLSEQSEYPELARQLKGITHAVE